MKIFRSFLTAIIVITASIVSAPASGAATTGASADTSVSRLLSLVPESIVIKQTSTLANGNTLTLYYKRSGDICEVYSETNLAGYGVNDLLVLKSTDFSIVSQPKGKRYYHATTAQTRRLIKRLVNAWL